MFYCENPLLSHAAVDFGCGGKACRAPAGRFNIANGRDFLAGLFAPTDTTVSPFPRYRPAPWRPVDTAGTLKAAFWIAAAIGLVLVIAMIAG